MVSDEAGHHYLKVLHAKTRDDQEAERFISKRRFYKQMKHSNEAAAQELLKDDPSYQHFQTMQRAAELPRSFFDGIRRNTLMMKDFAIQGQTDSLATAFACLGPRLQRLILDSNGMRDREFASLLQSIAKLPKFNSIVYSNNIIGPESLRFIQELLEKHPPGNLRELSIRDCQMAAPQSNALFSMLCSPDGQHQLLKLGLSGIQTSAENLRQLGRYVKRRGVDLLDLEVCSTRVAPKAFHVLLHALARNKTLRAVNLADNQI